MVLFPVAAGLYNMLIAKPGFECVHAGVRVLKFSFCSDVQYYQKVCFKAIIYSFFPACMTHHLPVSTCLSALNTQTCFSRLHTARTYLQIQHKYMHIIRNIIYNSIITLQIQSDITRLRRKSEHINLYYTLKINNKTFNRNIYRSRLACSTFIS